jgi:hypothetical protein
MPWLDDRRRLGFGIRGLALRGSGGRREIFLEDSALGKGWWAIEDAGSFRFRWTNGAAWITLPAPAETTTWLEVDTVPGTLRALAAKDVAPAARLNAAVQN